MIDVADKSNPFRVGSIPFGAGTNDIYSLAIHGRYLYAGNDVLQPTILTLQLPSIEVPALVAPSLKSRDIFTDRLWASLEISAQRFLTVGAGGIFSLGDVITTPGKNVGFSDAHLARSAAGSLSLIDSTNAQTFGVSRTYTSDSNLERLLLGATTTNFIVQAQNVGATSRPLEFITGTAAGGTNRNQLFLATNSFIGVGTAAPTSPGGYTPTMELAGIRPSIFLNETDTAGDDYEIGLNSGKLWLLEGSAVRASMDGSGQIGIGTNAAPTLFAVGAPGVTTTASGITIGGDGLIYRSAANTLATTNIINITTTGGLKIGPSGVTVTNILSGFNTLDFPSTLAQTDSDLPITVTGAADGDVVRLGVPNGSVQAGSIYTAWVSAANTVTVRFSVYGVTAKDPASGTFKAMVVKY